MTDIAALTRLVAPIVTDLGFALVRVQLNGAKASVTLQVMAEDPATGQLTLDQCAAISRSLSEMLDAEDPIDAEYRLEVSSPGIDRPLTRAADYARWCGHEVRMKLAASDPRKRLHGTILGIDGETVSLDAGAGGVVTVALAAIDGAKLVLTNRLIAATRPQHGELLSAGDADEIIETGGDSANDNDEED